MNIQDKKIVFNYKIIIAGPAGVGKTALFNRYCFNSFNMNTEMTIGINFHYTYLQIKKRKGVKVNNQYILNSIFDFGAQERFKPLLPQFIEGSNGVLLVFDLVSYTTFQKLDFWLDQIRTHVKDQNVPILLVGSKSDLLKEINHAQIVDEDHIKEYIIANNLDGFYKTSALENRNVLDVFKALTLRMLKMYNFNSIEI